MNIAILCGALFVLTLIFVFQAGSPLAACASAGAHRLSLFMLVWLGWTVGGQLSIINVMH